MALDNNYLNTCKADQTLVGPFDVRLKNFLIPYIPARVHPNHLTMASIVWIIFTCLSSYLVIYTGSISWLYLIVVALFGHYLTDLLDGELGRVRKTGYILWGFYMDHFFDYIFFVSIIGALYFIIPLSRQGLFVVFGLLLTMLFVHLHIVTIVQKTFSISFHRIGPSELRMMGVVFVLLIMYMPAVVFYIVGVATIIVCIVLVRTLYTTQKLLAQKDMENKMS